MQPFCGPASKNLAAYGRWHAARDNTDRSYLDALRPLLASYRPPTRFADTVRMQLSQNDSRAAVTLFL